MDLVPEPNEGPRSDYSEGPAFEIDQYMTEGEDGMEIAEHNDIGNGQRPAEPVLGTPRRLSEPPDESELFHETIPEAGRVIAEVEPKFVTQAAEHVRLGGSNPYHPFRDETDFELAKFLHNSGLSMVKIDELLKLKYFCARPPSYATASALRKLVEYCPDGGPRWHELEITPDFGAPSKPLTLLYRDPAHAISHLLSRPALAKHMTFAPKRFWKDQSKSSRVYSDFYSGNWWYTTQQSLPEGRTVVPVILGSDKTHLTNFTGDKKAWPLYLSIGNIAMNARSSPACDAWMLIAYIPVATWKDSKVIRKTLSARLFHQCMKIVLNPLVGPGETGIEMADALGKVRICVPLVAGYISDYPEQTLINCAASNVSPVFLASNTDLGSPKPHPPRTSEWILNQIETVTAEVDPNDILHYQTVALAHGLNGVHEPFWACLPRYRADLCLAPDVFHGPIRFGRDHILKWCKRLITLEELERRLSVLQEVTGLRHFGKGISHISQWTGREDKELQRVLVAVLAGAPNINARVMRNVRAFHDFLYLVQYRSHDDETLGYIRDALASFHRTKQVYIDTGARRGKRKKVIPHFHIPKLAAFHHYEVHIPEFGSSLQFTTEIIERNHKPFAKQLYAHTNHRDYEEQMCRILDRRERLTHFEELMTYVTRVYNETTLREALLQYSPAFQRRMQTILLPVPPIAPPKISKLVKTRKASRLWLNVNPTRSRLSLVDISAIYSLPDLTLETAKLLQTMYGSSTATTVGHLRNLRHADVWESLTIRPPDTQDEDIRSQAQTISARPPNDKYPYGHCHCVLVTDSPDACNVGIEGYRVAQVRLLFRLHFRGALRQSSGSDASTLDLAYVQWFTSPRRAEPDIDMFRVSRPELNGEHRQGSVIQLGSIARFVQLIPQFGPSVDVRYTKENSMDIGRHYFVNSFGSLQIYQAVY